MIGVSVKPVLVERRSERADPAVHHVARRDGVRAGLGLRDRGAREQLERLVVVDDAVARSTPQWPWVVYSHRHRSVMTSRSGFVALIARVASWITPSSSQAPEPSRVLARRQAEQQHGRDAERVRDPRLLDGAVDREVIDPRQLRDRGALRACRRHEHRVHEMGYGQLRLADEAAQHAGLTQATQAGGGKGHLGQA